MRRASLNLWLTAAVAVEIIVLAVGFRNWAGNDLGVYTAVGYQVAHGRVPYVDFAWAQGPAWPYVMGAFVRTFGASVLAVSAFAAAFSLLTLTLAITIARRVLTANGARHEDGVTALLVVALCSPYLWWVMDGVDSKSSFATALLLASGYLLYRGVSGGVRYPSLGAAGALLALLVGTKYTFASILPCVAVYVAAYAPGRRVRALAVVGVSGAVGAMVILAPIVRAAGARHGLGLVWDNFVFMSSDYTRRHTRTAEGFFNIGMAARMWLLVASGGVSFALAIASRPVQWRRLVRHENSILLLLVACGGTYLVANVVALFPNVWFEHYVITCLFVMLPVIVWASVVEATGVGVATDVGVAIGESPTGDTAGPSLAPDVGRTRVSRAAVRRLVVVALCAGVPHAALMLSERVTPLRPSWYAYEILGRNGVVNALDALAAHGLGAGDPATDYLYVGRAMNTVLPSRLTQSAYSAEGNNYMDGNAVDRDTANRFKLITLQNFGDVLAVHNVVVLASRWFEMEPTSAEQLREIRRQLAAARFERRIADGRLDLYVRPRLPASDAPPNERPGD